MKQLLNLACCGMLTIGCGITVHAQNVWTGSSVPTTTSGYVGIGNTSPAARLHISSYTGNSFRIENVNNLLGSNANIMEVYTRVNLVPAPPFTLVNWLSANGTFGLKTLASGDNALTLADASGNLKSTVFKTYSNPSAGTGTIQNCITGVVRMRFASAQDNTSYGGDLAGGINNGIYLSKIGVGTDASSSGSVLIKTDGTIECQSLVQTSDRNLKKEIQPLTGLTSKLMQVRAYSYKFRKGADTKTHFGFIAQEVEQEFPNLVNKDKEGRYALNYTEFIPLLLNAVKEQKEEIEILKQEVAALKQTRSAVSAAAGTDAAAQDVASLDQNTPNPFDRETIIRFNAGTNARNAFIGIYDLNGRQVQRITVRDDMHEVKISANTLVPGTYIYSLFTNGQMVDSKKMVVVD